MDNAAVPSAGQEDQALHLGPAQARQRLVLLHGWGADADDLLDLGELLVGPEVSVVALRAPEPHPYGSGRQWYGLQPIDWAALPAARAGLRGRLEALAASVPLEQTVLLGFSQGAAMAVDVGCGLPLAGIVACSGYPHEGWQAPTQRPPVLLSHGRQDPVVPYAASEALEQALAEAVSNAASGESQATSPAVSLLPFNGGHGIDPELMPALGAFVRRCLQPSGAPS
jgi:phospholipase/carboxylesterase